VVKYATFTATADSVEGPGSEGGEDSGLPPCQVVARDLEGSFTLATAKRGGREGAAATMLALPGI
jgi:hypothetical protein